MQKNIMKDPLFLSQKSTVADPESWCARVRDLQIRPKPTASLCRNGVSGISDWCEEEHYCSDWPMDLRCWNPRITKKQGPIRNRRRCLSHTGTKKTTLPNDWSRLLRPERQEEEHGNVHWLHAQVIQHEIDHLEGILIKYDYFNFADCFIIANGATA